jgi:hypothetical protein
VAGMLSVVGAQMAEPELPLVMDGRMPLYPIAARAARVQGTVKSESRRAERRSFPSR